MAMGKKAKSGGAVKKTMSKYVKEILQEHEENLKRRKEFIKQYAKWVKNTPNEEWSKAQNKLFS